MTIKDLVDAYLAALPSERQRLGQLLELLERFPSTSDLISRTNYAGHITSSGIVIAEDTGRILMMYHQSLQRYLQPGGHIEDVDLSPLQAAEREVREETPLTAMRYLPFHFNRAVPIDIDTHFIPANRRRKERDHYHHDFRYLFVVDSESVLPSQPDVGAPKYKWDELTSLKTEKSFEDLAHKIGRIRDREHKQLSFYDEITSSFKQREKHGAIVVTHLLPDVLEYLNAIEGISSLVAILPKQKSKDLATEAAVKAKYGAKVIDPIARESLKDPAAVRGLLAYHPGRIVLFDIGGWFAPAAVMKDPIIQTQLIGVVEDTENGHRKYDTTRDSLSVPVFSVARSPLKDNEDLLVGQSVWFSADALLREDGRLLQYMRCSVLGYGKIGRSIAQHMLSRGIKPWVYDIDPVLRIAAYNAQCEIPDFETIIKLSDVVFSATGSKALDIHDFRALKKGAYVVSVTSSDDEFDLAFLEGEYEQEEVRPHVFQYTSVNNYFYFVNKGNAVNFLHKAVLGDFIPLVRAEMIKAYECLLSGNYPPDLYTVDGDTRGKIASVWLKEFIGVQHEPTLLPWPTSYGEPVPLRRVAPRVND